MSGKKAIKQTLLEVTTNYTFGTGFALKTDEQTDSNQREEGREITGERPGSFVKKHV